jgi:hypothetical protein
VLLVAATGTAFVALSRAVPAEEAKPAAPAPVPIPYPNTSSTSSAIVSPRDTASGLPAGKRMHKPYVFSASDRKISLADGRTFVVNAQTGEIVFGDGVQGKRPETGAVPTDGKYRLGGGAAGDVEIRAGRIVIATPVPTPVPARATSKAK